MTEPSQDLESKFLEILGQPDLNEQLEVVAQAINDGTTEELSEQQRATLNVLLENGMPSPDRLIAQAACEEHNAKLRAQRAEDLVRRRERRAKRGKLGKRRRKRGL